MRNCYCYSIVGRKLWVFFDEKMSSWEDKLTRIREVFNYKQHQSLTDLLHSGGGGGYGSMQVHQVPMWHEGFWHVAPISLGCIV
jgi:hypothetical protein